MLTNIRIMSKVSMCFQVHLSAQPNIHIRPHRRRHHSSLNNTNLFRGLCRWRCCLSLSIILSTAMHILVSPSLHLISRIFHQLHISMCIIHHTIHQVHSSKRITNPMPRQLYSKLRTNDPRMVNPPPRQPLSGHRRRYHSMRRPLLEKNRV